MHRATAQPESAAGSPAFVRHLRTPPSYGRTEYGVHGLGSLVVKETQGNVGGNAKPMIVSRGYDAAGNKTSEVYPSGFTVAYTWNTINRFQQATDGLNPPPRTRAAPSACASGLVAALLVFMLCVPLRADDTRARIEEGLKANQEFLERGRAIAEIGTCLDAENVAASRAVLYLNLRSLVDPRSARVVARKLPVEDPLVVRFALAVLRALPDSALAQGGGVELVDALADLLDGSDPHLKAAAHDLLRLMSGRDMGDRGRAWRAWAASAPEQLRARSARPPFDESGYDPGLVEVVRQSLGLSRTIAGAVSRREPSSPKEEQPPSPLDLVVCVDISLSMESEMPAIQGQLLLLTRVLRLLPGEPRVGIVRYANTLRSANGLRGDLDRVDGWVRDLKATERGGEAEAILEALERALDSWMRWRRGARHRILVISDGPIKARDFERAKTLVAKSHRESGVVIDLVSPRARRMAQYGELAKCGGGRYVMYGRIDQVLPDLVRSAIGDTHWEMIEPRWSELLEILAAG